MTATATQTRPKAKQAKEDAFDAEVAVFAIEELGIELLDHGLFGRLRELNQPLQTERDAAAQEAQTLRATHAQLKPRVEAQTRVLTAEADRLFGAGDDDGAAKARQEIRELADNLNNIVAQAEAREQRVREIAERQGWNYQAVFEEAYPEIRAACIAVEIAVVQFLDKVDADLRRFGNASGIDRLVTNRHLLDLTPREQGPEKKWLEKLRLWFGK
jgi:hypothetical protein